MARTGRPVSRYTGGVMATRTAQTEGRATASKAEADHSETARSGASHAARRFLDDRARVP